MNLKRIILQEQAKLFLSHLFIRGSKRLKKENTIKICFQTRAIFARVINVHLVPAISNSNRTRRYCNPFIGKPWRSYRHIFQCKVFPQKWRRLFFFFFFQPVQIHKSFKDGKRWQKFSAKSRLRVVLRCGIYVDSLQRKRAHLKYLYELR